MIVTFSQNDILHNVIKYEKPDAHDNLYYQMFDSLYYQKDKLENSAFCYDEELTQYFVKLKLSFGYLKF